MPSDSGLAFVVIQHLEPTHESGMAYILGNCTSMKVVQAEAGMPVEANRVYANPAGKYLSIGRGTTGPERAVRSATVSGCPSISS